MYSICLDNNVTAVQYDYDLENRILTISYQVVVLESNWTLKLQRSDRYKRITKEPVKGALYLPMHTQFITRRGKLEAQPFDKHVRV